MVDKGEYSNASLGDRSVTSLPDSTFSDHHSGKPNGMETLFCPDCGRKCEHTGTNVFENQWCFTCLKCNAHYLRYSGRIEYIRLSECEICHIPDESLECPLCGLASAAGTVHQECSDREQATADRE